jgi:hypothetical protein
MNIKYSMLIFLVIVIWYSSCKNNDEVFATVTNTNLTVVNASADTLNFYLNGTRQNNTSSIFPAGSVVELSVLGGLQNYQFKKARGFTVLFSIPLTLKGVPYYDTDTSYYYSLYVAGESSSLAFSTTDTIPRNAANVTDTCFIRFVNASPNAGSLNAFVGDTVNFKARAFKSSSVFLPTGSGSKEVKIYQAGSANTIIDTTITFSPNLVYTLFSKGMLNGKGNSVFNVGLVVNNQPTVVTQ